MIEEVKTVDPPSQPAAEMPLEPQVRPRKGRSGSKSSRKVEVMPSEAPNPEEVITDGDQADGMTLSQAVAKWGPDVGQRIWDAAAGRRPPFTRSLSSEDPMEIPPEDKGTVYTGPHQDRGPVHLLPKPLEFNMKPAAFFKYWRMLSDDERRRVKVRPYRLWPVTDVMLLLSKEEQERVIRNERKPPTKTLPPGPLDEPFDPQNWQSEIFHRYGSGDYNFILTDTHPAINRKLCMTNIIGELRDMDTYPPAVDMRTLVVSDPGNESYIRWCSTKGIKVPGRDGEEEGEAEMAATVKVIDRAMDSLERQNKELREREKEREREARETKTNSNDAAAAAAKVVLDAANAAQSMLTESMKQTHREKDPMEYHKNVMETARALQPQGDSGAGMKEVMQLVISSNEKAAKAQADANTLVMNMILAQQKSLETRLEASEQRAAAMQQKMLDMTIQIHKPPDAAAGGAGATGPMTPATMMGEMGKMVTTVFGLVDKIADLSPRGKADEGSIWSRIAEKALEVAPNMMYNYSLAQRAAAAVRGTTLPDPQAPNQLGGGQTEEEDNAPPSEEEMAMQFLDKIEEPLLRALTSGESGQQFGALMTKMFGADTYEFIAQQSDDNLLQLLKNNMNIWTTIQKMSARFTQFITEFRDRATVSKIYQQMNVMGAAQTPPPFQSQPAAPAPVQAQPTPAPSNGAPAQVTQRLKPGQRVVHTPAGRTVVDATATVVPSTPAPAPAPPADPVPASA